ncbi:MAG: DUF177 domain-containing protein [Prevotellaceae bacterium]|jgi:uncharacterized metal-binding protein YceD (DUF177 family)|nr:DUF177 domain-containing protein [Prevotellaceae bacterium]
MENHNPYLLYLKQLTDEAQTVKYHLDREFFAKFASDQIVDGCVDVGIDIRKNASDACLCLDFDGVIDIICDRCCNTMPLHIDTKENVVVKFQAEYPDNKNDTILADAKTGVLDISDYMFETLILQIPIQNFHREGECNPAMIDKLKKYLKEPEKSRSDPRWEALKNINK